MILCMFSPCTDEAGGCLPCKLHKSCSLANLLCAERQYMPNSISMCQKVFSCCNDAQQLKKPLLEFSATLLSQQRNHSTQFILLMPQVKDSLFMQFIYFSFEIVRVFWRLNECLLTISWHKSGIKHCSSSCSK